VQKLVKDNTTGRSLGFLGEEYVNVVTLNQALDKEHPVAAAQS
jgi:K+-transporting ATPase ATPase C chain